MVIERALEKLRQAPRRRRRRSAPARGSPPGVRLRAHYRAGQALEVRPTFPHVSAIAAAIATSDPAAGNAADRRMSALRPRTGSFARAYCTRCRTNNLQEHCDHQSGSGRGQISHVDQSRVESGARSTDERIPARSGYEKSEHLPIPRGAAAARAVSYFAGDCEAARVFFSIGTANLAIAGGVDQHRSGIGVLGRGNSRAAELCDFRSPQTHYPAGSASGAGHGRGAAGSAAGGRDTTGRLGRQDAARQSCRAR